MKLTIVLLLLGVSTLEISAKQLIVQKELLVQPQIFSLPNEEILVEQNERPSPKPKALLNLGVLSRGDKDRNHDGGLLNVDVLSNKHNRHNDGLVNVDVLGIGGHVLTQDEILDVELGGHHGKRRSSEEYVSSSKGNRRKPNKHQGSSGSYQQQYSSSEESSEEKYHGQNQKQSSSSSGNKHGRHGHRPRQITESFSQYNRPSDSEADFNDFVQRRTRAVRRRPQQ